MAGQGGDGTVLTHLRTAPAQAACSTNVARAFEFLGKRWNGIILGTLRQGPTGFAAAGLVQREVTDTRPPGVTYSLTAKGQALGPILDQLGSWAADLPPCPRG